MITTQETYSQVKRYVEALEELFLDGDISENDYRMTLIVPTLDYYMLQYKNDPITEVISLEEYISGDFSRIDLGTEEF